MIVETYLDNLSSQSMERKNTGTTSNCGKMPFKGHNLLFTRTFMSRFLQLLGQLFCQQLAKTTPEVCPFTLTTKTKITCGMILYSV